MPRFVEGQAALAKACLAAALMAVACGDGTNAPTEPGPFRSEDFPRGSAAIFGVALDGRTLAPVPNLTVTLTPDDGLPVAQELESGIQAEARTNRAGSFTFAAIAEADYVLFVRFDAGHLGYGEVVGRVRGSINPGELRLILPAVDLLFVHPRDRGVVAPSDTARLDFRPIRVEQLVTLAPASGPLHARIDVFAGGGERGVPSRTFQVGLTEEELVRGEVRVPIDVGGLSEPIRLEPFLGLHVVYRDPRGGPAGPRDIRGRAVSVVSP